MNNTMSTSTTIFARTAPQNGSIALLMSLQPETADHRARQLTDTAQHHRHERIDDVSSLPEVRPDIADLRQRAAAESRDARAERKCIRIDPGRFNADTRGHAAVLRHRTHEETQTHPGEHAPRNR